VLDRVRTKIRDLLAAVDAFALRSAHRGMPAIVWPLIYGIVIGAGIFAMRHTSWLPLIDANKIKEVDDYTLGAWSGATFGAILLLYGVVMIVRRVREGDSGGLTTVVWVNRLLRPLLALPLVTALMRPNIEQSSPKETHFLIALAALAVGGGVYYWVRPAKIEFADLGPDDPPRRSRALATLAKVAAGLAVLALWAGYGGFFSWLSITNHHSLNTRTTDLGYYDNIFWNSIHGKFLGCSFIRAGYHGSAHFDPLLVLISPLYLLYPRAEFLLVLQSVWLGAGVVPLYLLARHKLQRRLPAVAIAAMYAVYPALHGANMYEFHSLSLIAPVLLTLLWLLEIGAYRAYYIVLAPALLCREDIALLMCFVGAYAIYTRKAKMVRLGWITILVSLVYFAVVKKFFMTSADIFMSGPEAYSFAYYYEDLIPNKNGLGGMLVTLATNPVFVIRNMLSEPKIHYMLVLFMPVLFLPAVAKPGRVMMLYGLLFTLLASRTAVYSPHFQYSCIILPVIFALTPTALRDIEDGRLSRALGLDGPRLSRALVAGAFTASLLVSWKFGGVLENTAFRGGFMKVSRSIDDKERETYAWVKENAAKIPRTAVVGTTNRLGAHVSNRRTAYFYPEHQNVDYLFIDEAELRGADTDRHRKAVAAGTFVLLARHQRLALYQRAPKK
jgi:uncharacterized membrane protein